jgi:hypothetical protein
MEIERVAAKDHPYTQPGVVYHALLLVLSRSEANVRKALQLFPENKKVGDRASVMTVENEDRTVQSVALVFNLADRVDSPRIPFEMIRALSWAAESLLGLRCNTIIRLDTVYTYSITSCKKQFCDDRDWARQWEQALKSAECI